MLCFDGVSGLVDEIVDEIGGSIIGEYYGCFFVDEFGVEWEGLNEELDIVECLYFELG